MYERRILLGFMRVHILHHATEVEGIYGVGIMEELERHGYGISPGTLYPILHEMEKGGLLRSRELIVGGKVRKVYRATRKGITTLHGLKRFVTELSEEVLG
jgi:DNA-binding PadR family transcriptional regulator